MSVWGYEWGGSCPASETLSSLPCRISLPESGFHLHHLLCGSQSHYSFASPVPVTNSLVMDDMAHRYASVCTSLLVSRGCFTGPAWVSYLLLFHMVILLGL